jgi:repressor LexA
MEMTALTPKQQQVLDFIRETHHKDGIIPTLREIAHHFGFRSMNAAADHVRALRKKKALSGEPRRARSLRIVGETGASARRVMDVPLFGTIPAGMPDERRQHALGTISIDPQKFGLSHHRRVFALRVAGDSMVGRHIIDGDVVLLEHGTMPRNGDVVAALIDQQSTLKTFVMNRSKPYLRAENPRYPALIPAEELMIQGVMVGLIRTHK